MKIIYDVGSNNGDDIAYYLLKADKVVAIEANPDLAELIRQRFADPIAQGRVVLEACVVTVDDDRARVPFFISRGHHVLSQFEEPSRDQITNFNRVELPARSLISIIEQYGRPYYVKIDVEGYDQVLLDALFKHGIFPPYLSAESHSIEVFASLVANARYTAFKIVDGSSNPHEYANHLIETETVSVPYSNPDHSAGTFGNYVKGPWQTPAAFLHTLAHYNLGWRDIHVSRVDQPG